MKLYIAEKPSVAKVIAAELGINERKDGYMVAKTGDLISWCFGHLMGLAEPDAYLSADVPAGKSGCKIWREQDLPIFPRKWLKEVKKDCKKQFKLLGSLLKKCDQVVNCGDPDREGQLLIDEVLEHYGNKKPVLRYWVSAQDSASVKKGLRNLQPNAKFRGMLLAAKGRERADWLIGMNLSRAYTLAARRDKNDVLLAVGRVQTPTLNLVAKRDLAIKNFKPVPYYVIKGSFGSGALKFTAFFKPSDDFKGLDAEKRLISAAAAKAVLQQAQSAGAAKVTAVENKKRSVDQPKAFSLADMQQLASAKWGFSAQHTLDLCQSLYEKHKLTSYPRTDCPYLPEVQHAEAAKVLQAVKAVNPELATLIDGADLTIKSKTWNDAKITAHHGLIPTMQRGDKSALSADELKIYDAIVRRYIAQFYPPCIMGSSSVSLDVSGLKFAASGSVMLSAGFKKVLGNLDDDDEKAKDKEPQQKIPALKEGQQIPCGEFKAEQKKTTPPAAFTEGTLIRAMENIHTVVDDPKFKKFLKDGDGIGTSATRAAIIDELKRKGYLEERGKKICCTQLGFKLLALLPDMVKNPVLTALFESKLRQVEAGKMTLEQFEAEQRTFVRQQVEKARTMKIGLLK